MSTWNLTNDELLNYIHSGVITTVPAEDVLRLFKDYEDDIYRAEEAARFEGWSKGWNKGYIHAWDEAYAQESEKF